jgi:hypothetical protein
MPAEMARLWAPVPSQRSAADWDALKAYDAARAAHRATPDGPRLSSFAPARLVNLSNRVAGPSRPSDFSALSGGTATARFVAQVDATRQREMRRARHRLRAAAQRVVRVELAVREDRSFEVLDESTGELVTVEAAIGTRRKRMGQKLCGRATSMALPGKGETIGSGRAERAQSVELIQRPDGRVGLRNI